MSDTIFDNDLRWFAYYTSLQDLEEKAKRAYQTVIDRGQRAQVKINDDYLKENIPDIYPNMKLLDELIDTFDEYQNSIDMGGSFKKKRLEITDDKRFIFSFGLAAKGLLRVPEYFNQDIAIEYPTMFNSGIHAGDETMVPGVVDTNIVQSKKLSNGTYFYCEINGKNYELRQQQKGVAKMLIINPMAKLILGDNGMYHTDPTHYNGFSLVFSSSTKKSYLKMENEGGKAKEVDIYIPLELANRAKEKRLAAMIPILMAIKFFERSGIRTRVNIIRPYYTMQDNRKYASIIFALPIKDFTESIDWNKIGVLRGLFDTGFALASLNITTQLANYNITKDKEIRNVNKSVVRLSEGRRGVLTYNDEQLLQEEFARYKNWLREEVNNGRLSTKVVPNPLMLTYSTTELLETSLESAQEIGKSGEIRKKIERAFFSIIDIVDLYYNPKTTAVVERIKTRMWEEGSNLYALKAYLIELAGKLYRDYVPMSGPYASTQEQVDTANEDYRKLLQKIGAALEKYE
jgi:hypothetical protein